MAKDIPLQRIIDKFNPLVKLGLALLIIGAFFALAFSLLYDEPSEIDNGMGIIGGQIIQTNEPCAFFAGIFSLLALLFGFIAVSTERYDLAMAGSVFLLMTLLWPSMILAVISFLIFFSKGFD